VQTFGRIDVMINNAGIMPRAPLERLTIGDWNRTIDINIKGVLYGIAAALPHMKQQKAGHIINVSSVAGHKVGPSGVVYAATNDMLKTPVLREARSIHRSARRVHAAVNTGRGHRMFTSPTGDVHPMLGYISQRGCAEDSRGAQTIRWVQLAPVNHSIRLTSAN
jgi:NADP-dependent 3-hydroxy acid dehydrogenase YdfG